jgi:hypothetical protein
MARPLKNFWRGIGIEGITRIGIKNLGRLKNDSSNSRDSIPN